MRKTTVLIVEAQPVLSQGVAIALGETADLCVIGACDTVAAARELAATIRPDVVVIDELVDDGSLLATLPSLDCAVVLLGEGEQLGGGARAMSGAPPLLPKECSLEDLAAAIRHAHAAGPIPAARAGTAPASRPTTIEARAAIEPEVGPRRSGLHDLTRREIEILELLVQGKTHRVIAEELGLAVNTVRTHTHNIHLKLNVHSDLGAVSLVLGEGGVGRRWDERTPPSSNAEREP